MNTTQLALQRRGLTCREASRRGVSYHKGFDELFQKGFATRDSGSKWVLIHKYLMWNPLENPNQAKAAVKMFEQIPASGDVKSMVVQSFECVEKQLRQDFETLWNPLETVSKPFGQPLTASGMEYVVPDTARF